MKEVWGALVSTVLAFVVTLLLNFGVQILTLDKGSIRVGPAVNIRGQLLLPVAVTNYTSDVLDNVILSIPATVSISSTVASSPVRIVPLPDSVGTVNVKRVSVSGLEPHQVTELLIPVASQVEAELARPVNAQQQHLAIESSTDIRNRWEVVLGTAAIYSLVYALTFFVFQLWIAKRDQQVKAHLDDELKKDRERFQRDKEDLMASLQEQQKRATENAQLVEKTQKSVDKNQIEIDKAHKYSRRIQILLLSRISDYAKELDFGAIP